MNRGNGAPLPYLPVSVSTRYARRPSPAVAHVSAAALAAAACIVTAWSGPLADRAPFMLPLASVILALWIGGWKPGTTAASIASALLAVFLLESPDGGLAQTADQLRLATFVMIGGALIGFSHVADRATGRALAIQALSQTVVEHAPVLVTGADVEGRIVLFNRACEEVTGYRREEVLGKPLLDTFVPASWRETVAARFRDEPVERLAAPHENPWITRERGERLIEWRCFRTTGFDGQLITLGIGQDVTERHLARVGEQAALERERAAHAATQHANATKEKFIATLSHELRSPLQAALGWLRLVRTQTSDDRLLRGLTTADRNLAFMSGLIEDVIEYARIEAGRLTLAMESTDLAAIVDDAVSMAGPIADGRGVVMRAHVEAGLPRITGDHKRLQQILQNILANAIKFTPRGGGVVLRATRDETGVLIAVRDTGHGIHPDHLPRVFDPFWQSNVKPEERSGLGLGLALVKQLVEAQHGTVAISSDGPGSGTLVTVWFPAESAGSAEHRRA